MEKGGVQNNCISVFLFVSEETKMPNFMIMKLFCCGRLDNI